MDQEVKSIVSIEVNLTKKIMICSPIGVINNESLEFLQKLTVPNYLQSLDFDISGFELNSKVVEIEVDRKLENPNEIFPNKLYWNYDEKHPKKYVTK